ncbi:hypothetical protein [Gloeothece citriformis]|uniref:hypothetical protein n=1 Tax=Gloeothece citriformis TaxID=2546356 RepID=UPI000173BD6B|nr:hypothetical protein [Gloeothece citriformis]
MNTANSGLKTIEYLFVAVTMVGIALATFTQEITYAAIPLIISLLLNLFNRQQVEENILGLEKKLLEEQQKNPEKLPSSSYSDSFRTLDTKIEDIQRAIAQLQQDFQQLSSGFNPREFQSQLRDLQTTVTRWQNRFESLNSVDLNPLEAEIKQLQQRLDSLAQVQSDLEQIKQNYPTLEVSIQDYKGEINNLLNLIQSLPTRSELEDLKHNLDALTQVKTEINNLVNWESFNELSRRLNHLEEQFNHRPEPETIHNLSNELKGLSESVSHLWEQFNQRSEPETIHNLANEVKSLSESVSHLWEQFNQRSEPETIHNLANEVKGLSESLSHLWEQFNQRSEPETIHNLANEVKSLSESLSHLWEQFNQRSEPETIHNLANEVKSLSESVSHLDFEQFREQIKKLREQFEAIPQKDLVEALSTQRDELNKIEQELEKVEEEISANQSSMNPKTQQRILKPKPRRVRVHQRRR